MGPTSGAANRGWHCNATAAAETNVSRRTRARLTCIHIVETTVSDVYGLPGWSACGLWASHTPGIGSWQKAPQEIPWHVSASRVTGSTAIRRIGIGPRPLTGRVGAVDVGGRGTSLCTGGSPKQPTPREDYCSVLVVATSSVPATVAAETRRFQWHC